MTSSISNVVAQKLMGVIEDVESVSEEITTNIRGGVEAVQDGITEIGENNQSVKDDLAKVSDMINLILEKVGSKEQSYEELTQRLQTISYMLDVHDEVMSQIESRVVDTTTLALSIGSVAAIHRPSIKDFIVSVDAELLREVIDKDVWEERRELLYRVMSK